MHPALVVEGSAGGLEASPAGSVGFRRYALALFPLRGSPLMPLGAAPEEALMPLGAAPEEPMPPRPP